MLKCKNNPFFENLFYEKNPNGRDRRAGTVDLAVL
jgi:hypothetical protein